MDVTTDDAHDSKAALINDASKHGKISGYGWSLR